jgi:hypothetical protein
MSVRQRQKHDENSKYSDVLYCAIWEITLSYRRLEGTVFLVKLGKCPLTLLQQ